MDFLPGPADLLPDAGGAGSPLRRMLMREIGYVVRGFLTIRRDSLRVPVSGSLTVHADLDSGLFSGDRLAGSYHRPPFTGCGWITPVVNLLVAGPGNAVVIDLIPEHAGASAHTRIGA
jgi:hypothetical protein